MRGRDPVPRGRLVCLLTILSLAFGVLGWRLIDVQAVSSQRYTEFGESQRLRSLVLPATRGSIVDRNGNDLAISVERQTIFADPSLVTDPAAGARALSPILGLDERDLRDRLSAEGSFVYLARQVDDAVATQVRDLRIDGVGLRAEPKRYNPAGSLASPLLGQVGVDDVGVSGLETQYDEALTGTAGQLVAERDPVGRGIAGGFRQLSPPRSGDNLVLTIDKSMQFETERLLAEQIVNSNSRAGICVVMNPRTGEVLAMANMVARDDGPPVPSADNMAVTRVYEPGSVNKVVTVAGALEEDLVAASTRMNVPDTLRVSDGVFTDDEPHPPGYWSIGDILTHSSNVGTIMLGKRLGKSKIDHYLREFGLASVTDLEFPGESAGLLLDTKKWSGTSIATVPIGQGVAVTAMQMLGAYNTIANGGVYVAPSLVKGVVESSGRLRPAQEPSQRRVISAETARVLTDALTRAVREGTGTQATIANYTVAGKTGTSRKPHDTEAGYREGAYVASFAGFVPAESPRLSSIVVLDEPTPYYGGLVAAPLFGDLAEVGVRLFDIPPRPTGDDAGTLGLTAVPQALAGIERPGPAHTPASMGSRPRTGP